VVNPWGLDIDAHDISFTSTNPLSWRSATTND
jgi:hypothetical protein